MCTVFIVAIHISLGSCDTVATARYKKRLLRKINGIAQEYQVQVIVIYHPAIGLSADGSVQRKDDPQAVRQFEQICVREGILFCDMGERFLSEYKENHVLPYGFFNSSVGN